MQRRRDPRAGLNDATRPLVLGIGGGGDVAGALVVAEHFRTLGRSPVLGGLTWERRPIDPLPGPRRIGEIEHAQVLHPAAALAGPDTSGPGGFRFAESHMARFLGEQTVLIDINDGPAAVAAGIEAAARHLGCDLVVLLDVGGDVLAHGDEPGLASPLADAVVLAAAPAVERAGLPVLGAVFGAGCDGELTPDEVGERLAELREAGGIVEVLRPAAEHLERLEAALEFVPTEASAMAARAARGETGVVTIRDGRRSVQLSPLGGEVHMFDPAVAIESASRLARAVLGAESLQEANAIIRGTGAGTELAYEVRAAGGV